MVDGIGRKPPVSPAFVPGSKGTSKPGGFSFSEALESAGKKQEVVFSAHARDRMEQREIRLQKEDFQKIAEAVTRAGAKGARSSLLLYGEIALVANVPNRTIITAVDRDGAREYVFTGIDSAVIIK